MHRIIRNDVVYSNTTIQLPYSLKEVAKERGINLSRTLVEALTAKLAGDR
jgi:post-segregation antitoxin (ccd killing protein)